MTDFSPYTAGEIVDWLSQGVDMPAAPATIWVSVLDDTGTELSSSLTSARQGVTAGTGWTKNGTDFENANEITLGEATQDLTNIQEVRLHDSETAGEVLTETTATDAPFDISEGTELVFEPGDIQFDVEDFSE